MMNRNIAPLIFLLAVVPYVFADEDEEEEADGEEDPWKKHWMAHGICASIAWAILVPLAIGSSLLRKTLEKHGFHEDTWFTIHFTLNTLAALLTVVAFSIAVYIIRTEDGKSPWKEYPHFIVGLVIFVMTLLQAVIGMLRPRHHAEPNKEEQEVVEGEEEEEKVAPEKSTLRAAWEVKHRLFGTALLGMAWYNIYSGWELFEDEVGGEDMGKAWLGTGGGVLGLVLVLYTIQKIRS
jgi:hypothetical protein